MKSGVWLSQNRRYLVICDGTNVEIEGSGNTADELRSHVQGENSLYSRTRDASGDEFDPIGYIFNRSYMVNAMGRNPEEFSDENVARNRQYLKMLEEGSRIPSQEMSQIRKS